jgi:hypothetical protein
VPVQPSQILPKLIPDPAKKIPVKYWRRAANKGHNHPKFRGLGVIGQQTFLRQALVNPCIFPC